MLFVIATLISRRNGRGFAVLAISSQ